MGSGESTRKVTLERDFGEGNPGIVRVSESVVRRLKGQRDLPLDPKEDVTPEELNKLWNELQREKVHLHSQREKIQSMLERVYQREQDYENMPIGGDVINNEELERRQREVEEKEHAMISRENELLEEIESLKCKNSEIHTITEDQFNLAVEEVKQKFSQAQRPAVCQDLMSSVFACYKQNPHQTLRCSKMVQEFVACVEKSRLNSLQDSKF
ncbi:MICOS complex subunit MIC19 [Nematostella vectensis]|uniref:MICOS complex subunit MIC19 n=1 Tax=Nematostella vectensis TaxID=45351 RepID=UPI002076F2F8|nr:MICOS complex subunit MIC19 [Nematostella vectensis]